MTSNGSVDLPSEEWGRVSTASSLVGLVSRYVIDLQQLSREQMPGWLVGLDLPAGWRSGRLEGRSGQPWRISVCGPQPDGGRDGCETIAVYGYSGAVASKMLLELAGCTLVDLGAVDIETVPLVSSPADRIGAVRSTGCFAAAGLWIWAQHSYFAARTSVPGRGILIQQSVFVESSRRAVLGPDVAMLSNVVLNAFVGAAGSGP